MLIQDMPICFSDSNLFTYFVIRVYSILQYMINFFLLLISEVRMNTVTIYQLAINKILSYLNGYNTGYLTPDGPEDGNVPTCDLLR